MTNVGDAPHQEKCTGFRCYIADRNNLIKRLVQLVVECLELLPRYINAKFGRNVPAARTVIVVLDVNKTNLDARRGGTR